MKRKQKKIGQQRYRPFPVVNARLRPIGKDISALCGVKTCQSLEFLPERPQAAFLAQPCGDVSIFSQGGFTEQERGELAWEKAYREQLAGKEPEPIGYPICAQCAAFAIAQFLNEEDEQNAALLLTTSMTTGNDLVLFDRNLSRERTDPSVAVGTFETLADFRRRYWAEVSA